jgi:DNA-binding response OmpR family regulator
MPKLLLADDSVTIQRVIELTFADENVQVIAVGDGQQAIDRIKADRPDIVLADIGMPERDGYEVASFVKSTPELSHIPVLLLTGAFEPVDEARARSVGSDGVLVKPFEPQMVIARVRELLNRPSDGSAAPALVAARPLSATASTAPPVKPASSVGTAELDRLEPEPPVGGSRDALEDYFDRLDAALASMSTAPPPLMEEAVPFDLPSINAPNPAPSPEIVLNSGNVLPAPPDQPKPPAPAPVRLADAPLSTPAPAPAPQPARPPITPVVPAAAQAPPAPVPVPPPVRSEAPRTQSETPAGLHEAFAALLSAEESRPIAPAAGEPMSEEAIEAIVRQVVARMQNDDLRRLVIDTAERLVREEIDRIKSLR